MKLKKLLKLVSSDTKIEVIFKDDSMDKPLVLYPSEYSKHENLQVKSLNVGKKSGILYVYINAIDYYYNYETDKYEKAMLNWD